MVALAWEGSPGLWADELERGVGGVCALLCWVSSAELIHTSVESPQGLLQGPALVSAASSPLGSPPNSTQPAWRRRWCITCC